MKFTGRVCEGYGVAKRDVERGIYHLPYEPYPGTLNLDVETAVIDALDDPQAVVEHGNITRRLWPASIGRLGVHVMHPAGGSSDPTKLEVLAPVRLRDAFDLSDGDEVEVTLG